MNGSGFHMFRALGLHLLFHEPTMACYALSPATRTLLSARRPGAWWGGRGIAALRHGPIAAGAAFRASRDAGLLRRTRGIAAVEPESLRPLSTLELCVTHACNLACRYCYGSRDGESCATGLLYGAREARMSPETARKGIETLFARSGRLAEVRVVFFGGEPLLNFSLVREATIYAEERAGNAGKRVRFSAVSNGTLLTPEVMEFAHAHRIHLQISMDGPPEVHDANRVFRNGNGSYGAVCRGVSLLARAQRHPPARATAAHGNLDAPGVLRHLRELGFGSVHVEPALWGSGPAGLDDADIDTLLRQEEEVARLIVAGIDEGEVRDYHALTRLIRETRVIRERRRYFCGAGRGLVCLASDGAYYPCHRLAGREEYRLGDVAGGIDDARREPYRQLHVDARPGCRACWARYICGGGCWDHAIGAHGRLEQPDEEKACRVMRRRIELALAVNALLKAGTEAPDSDGEQPAGCAVVGTVEITGGPA